MTSHLPSLLVTAVNLAASCVIFVMLIRCLDRMKLGTRLTIRFAYWPIAVCYVGIIVYEIAGLVDPTVDAPPFQAGANVFIAVLLVASKRREWSTKQRSTYSQEIKT